MKSLLILFILFINVGVIFASDTTTVWVTVNDLSILPNSSESTDLTSTNSEFQELIEAYQIISIQQALPASRKENLLKVYELTAISNQDALISAISQSDLPLERAEPGPTYQFLYEPDDFYLTFADDYALEIIGAQEAWDYTFGDSSVHIAISDGNYDFGHSELAGTVKFVGPSISYPSVYHGTAVATIAAGNTDNSIGKSAIGANSSLELYAMNYNALLLASTRGCKVINVSWMSGCSYIHYYQEVINEVYENGSIVIAAAGNGNVSCGSASNKVYPASFNHVISVTSVGPMANHERFPGDLTSTHQHNDAVDYCAPGYDVALTVLEGWYLTGNGTSFAAPYVSGTVALMLSVNPCLTFEQVEAILDSTSANIDLLNPGYEGLLGEGLIHAAKAVELAMNWNSLTLDIDMNIGCGPGNASAYFLEVINPASGPFSFEWNTGSTDTSITDLVEGWYYLSVENDNGCFGYDSLYVENNEEITIDFETFEPICYNDQNGEIMLSLEGGMGDYSIVWGNGENSNVLTDLNGGTYYVTITDEMGCSASDSVTLDNPEPINIEFLLEENSLGQTLEAISTGGTGEHIYEWNTGGSSPLIINPLSGWKTVFVMDEMGCSNKDSIYVKENSQVLESEDYSVNNFKIYPNPASAQDVIHLSIPKSFDAKYILIYGIDGKLILEMPISSQTNVLLPQLEAGRYTVLIQNETANISQSLIVF